MHLSVCHPCRPWLHPYHIDSYAGWLISSARRQFSFIIFLTFRFLHLLAADRFVLVWELTTDRLVIELVFVRELADSQTLPLFQLSEFSETRSSHSETSCSTPPSNNSFLPKSVARPSKQRIFWPCRCDVIRNHAHTAIFIVSIPNVIVS